MRASPPKGSGPASVAGCLVVGPSWVGDMIMAQSLYKVLADAHPGMAIDVLASAWSAGILGRMPEVRRALASPFAHGQFDWAGRRRLAAELRREAYDRAIVLPNSWKSALVPFLAGIPRRTGYVGECRYGLLNDARRLDRRAIPRLVDRYVALAFPAGEAVPVAPQPRLAVDARARQASLARLGLRLDRPVLALCPGAEYGPAKRWPEAHYAAVARARLAEGWQVWLFGSAKDKPVTGAIVARLPAPAGPEVERAAVVDLAGRTSLEEAVDLLSCARCVVTNDSGLMHLAAAVEVPVVALYGSTDPGYTPPFSGQARVLRLGLDCSPCFKRECPYGHLDCLRKLRPESVNAAIDELLAKPAGASVE